MAAGILGGDCFGNLRISQTVSSSLLNSDELTGVIIVLHVTECLHNQRIAGYEPDSPASHVIGLGERVQFYADILRTRNGQEAQRLHAIIS
ncbi:hypothetical protein D3C72_1945290 [compost metagenome]